LRLLEEQGESRLDVAEAATSHNEVRQALQSLGVMSVEVCQTVPPGTIILASINVGTTGWHDLEDSLEVCAAKKARQLGKARSDVERILFVWVDPSSHRLTLAFDHLGDPTV